jgi:hypothetical protein
VKEWGVGWSGEVVMVVVVVIVVGVKGGCGVVISGEGDGPVVGWWSSVVWRSP